MEDSDMPVNMQIQAMAIASHALDLYDVLACKSIAAHIKKEKYIEVEVVGKNKSHSQADTGEICFQINQSGP